MRQFETAPSRTNSGIWDWFVFVQMMVCPPLYRTLLKKSCQLPCGRYTVRVRWKSNP